LKTVTWTSKDRDPSKRFKGDGLGNLLTSDEITPGADRRLGLDGVLEEMWYDE
jgi:hypothetical protein